jgi:alkanesulfonate monooxygenase SsuD/methylene tetrahydromethanopterin reductase-like flavin-dependent oxidoreductase (luciferase family)
MKVGLFDHVEYSGRSLATVFDERLEFVAAADEAGFWGYHMAEHHCTPLNMVPSPGVYLGALARATRNIRLGPLCYLLPLYSPLRLAEEICMLDHLSRGRLEIGIGRGVSPFELNYNRVDHEDSRNIFMDAYACLREALQNDSFSYKGKYFTYENVPMPLRPLQEPTPAFWYGSSNTTGATWAGEQGMQFVVNGPTSLAKANMQAYLAALAARGGQPEHRKAEFKGGVARGMLRHIVVADTDEAAQRIARPAFEHHLASLNWLRKKHNSTEFTARQGAHANQTYEACENDGMVIVGTPETVYDKIAAQAKDVDINYLMTYLFFGDMSLTQAQRSLSLFRQEVMPRLAAL